MITQRIALGAALVLGACQAVAPTIAQREGVSTLQPDDVHVSMAEDYPDDLAQVPDALSADTPSVAPDVYVAPHIGGTRVSGLRRRDVIEGSQRHAAHGQIAILRHLGQPREPHVDDAGAARGGDDDV